MSIGKFATATKDIFNGIGKFYGDHRDEINGAIGAFGKYRAATRDPSKPPSRMDAALAAYTGAQGSRGQGGVKGLFGGSADIDINKVEEERPQGGSGTYKFKISGFSSSPFIRLKQ